MKRLEHEHANDWAINVDNSHTIAKLTVIQTYRSKLFDQKQLWYVYQMQKLSMWRWNQIYLPVASHFKTRELPTCKNIEIFRSHSLPFPSLPVPSHPANSLLPIVTLVTTQNQNKRQVLNLKHSEIYWVSTIQSMFLFWMSHLFDFYKNDPNWFEKVGMWPVNTFYWLWKLFRSI